MIFPGADDRASFGRASNREVQTANPIGPKTFRQSALW